MGHRTTERQGAHDDDLVAAAHRADAAALDELLSRHLHPAWRMALVAAPDPGAAENALVTGFCDALIAAQRNPDPTVSFRERVVGTTRRSGAAAPPTGAARPATDEPVLAAFRALPEQSRAAIWLSEVEGGTPEQTSKVLGLDRSSAAALTDRATAALRDRLAADIAARADSAACRKALGKLPALAAGKLTAPERAAVQEHMSSCGSCALWLAALVAPRPALRQHVLPLPGGAALAIAERWGEYLERDRAAWLAPWTERAIGAAAAAVLAVGLAGVALLRGDDRTDGDGTQLAAPAGPNTPAGAGEGESAVGTLPGTEPPTTTGSTGTGTGGNGSSGTATGAGGSATNASPPVKKPDPAPVASTPTVPSTPSTPSTPTTPVVPTDPAPAPAPDPAPVPEPDDVVPQVAVGVAETIEVAAGECTGVNLAGTVVGCDPETTGPINIVIDLPLLPPISI